MRNFLHGLPLVGTISASFAAGALLASCADENPWGSSSNQDSGSISVSVSTDETITTSKPLFRSEADDNALIARCLTFPEQDDFKLTIEKADGTYSKTWNRISDFIAKDSTELFTTGVYNVTAFYGKNGKQGFDTPYFEASQQVTVLSDRKQKVDLTASLQNSMIVIDYTDAFKAYMDTYKTTLHTEGLDNDIEFRQGETRAAFVEPKEVTLKVHFTTRELQESATVAIPAFAPLAANLHHITFDINEPERGYATLVVGFDDSLNEETVSIDLTDELFTTAAPAITCVGFENGATVNTLAGTSSDSSTGLKMEVFAEGGIRNAILTVTGEGTNKEYDLCAATTDLERLAEEGIKSYGFKAPTDMSAWIDFTEFSKTLKHGEYSISLSVTDKNGATCDEPASVKLNCQPITANLIGCDDIVYGSCEAYISIEYNGLSPIDEIQFLSSSDGDEFVDARIISCEAVNATRAYETRQYKFTVEIPEAITQKVYFRIKLGNNADIVSLQEVRVNQPVYTISAIDAHSRYAYVRLATESGQMADILRHLKIFNQAGGEINILDCDASTGIVTIDGLTPGTRYGIETDITGTKQCINQTSFDTEAELPIPNGDFTNLGDKLTSGTLTVGGGYRGATRNYDITSSFSYDQPADWANLNSLTAWSGTTEKNTWFIVPSTWVENGKAVIRSVAFDHDGTVANLERPYGTYYCKQAPTFTDDDKRAGEIFLGSYSYNGTESRTNGTSFSSRPSSISFDYEYSPIESGDAGEIIISVLDANGESIVSESKTITGTGNMTVQLPAYGTFSNKASKLYICFRSSNMAVPPIHVPTDNELNEGFTTPGNKTLPANTYHALATGSVLTIDNVTAHYEERPGVPAASAPKKATKPSKRK